MPRAPIPHAHPPRPARLPSPCSSSSPSPRTIALSRRTAVPSPPFVPFPQFRSNLAITAVPSPLSILSIVPLFPLTCPLDVVSLPHKIPSFRCVSLPPLVSRPSPPNPRRPPLPRLASFKACLIRFPFSAPVARIRLCSSIRHWKSSPPPRSQRLGETRAASFGRRGKLCMSALVQAEVPRVRLESVRDGVSSSPLPPTLLSTL